MTMVRHGIYMYRPNDVDNLPVLADRTCRTPDDGILEIVSSFTWISGQIPDRMKLATVWVTSAT